MKILREADAAPVSDVAKEYRGSEQTLYVWRKRFGKMTAPEAKRLKTLVAERGLAIEVMQEISRKKW